MEMEFVIGVCDSAGGSRGVTHPRRHAQPTVRLSVVGGTCLCFGFPPSLAASVAATAGVNHRYFLAGVFDTKKTDDFYARLGRKHYSSSSNSLFFSHCHSKPQLWSTRRAGGLGDANGEKRISTIPPPSVSHRGSLCRCAWSRWCVRCLSVLRRRTPRLKTSLRKAASRQGALSSNASQSSRDAFLPWLLKASACPGLELSWFSFIRVLMPTPMTLRQPTQVKHLTLQANEGLPPPVEEHTSTSTQVLYVGEGGNAHAQRNKTTRPTLLYQHKRERATHPPCVGERQRTVGRGGSTLQQHIELCTRGDSEAKAPGASQEKDNSSTTDRDKRKWERAARRRAPHVPRTPTASQPCLPCIAPDDLCLPSHLIQK